MRTVIQAFIKGQCGSHYLFADVGMIEEVEDTGMHSNRDPALVLPDECLQARALDPMVRRCFVLRRAPNMMDGWVWHDMMIADTTMAKKQQYLRYDDNEFWIQTDGLDGDDA